MQYMSVRPICYVTAIQTLRVPATLLLWSSITKYFYDVVNRFGGVSLPVNSRRRLTDRARHDIYSVDCAVKPQNLIRSIKLTLSLNHDQVSGNEAVTLSLLIKLNAIPLPQKIVL